jgi:hypothetical protein
MRIPNAVAELESLSYAELLELRAHLVDKGNGKPSDLSDHDLDLLVNCFGLLRRRQSGPPGEKKKAAAKAPSQSVEDLLGL